MRKNVVAVGSGKCRAIGRPLWIIILGVAVLCAACAAPANLGYSPRNDEEGFIAQTVVSMVEALLEGDTERFMSKVSTGYYRGYATLGENLKKSLAERLKYSLDVKIEDISIVDAKIIADVWWKGDWTVKSSGEKKFNEGRTRLIFMKTMGIKLIDYEGASLFGF